MGAFHDVDADEAELGGFGGVFVCWGLWLWYFLRVAIKVGFGMTNSISIAMLSSHS